MTKILDHMNLDAADAAVGFDLASLKDRHARRLADFSRWKSDIWPQDYDDITALIDEVERLRALFPSAEPLVEENRRLSERLSELQQEAWWFSPARSSTRGDSGGPI